MNDIPPPPHVIARADQMFAAVDNSIRSEFIDDVLLAVTACDQVWPYNRVALEDEKVSEAVRFYLSQMVETMHEVGPRVVYPLSLHEWPWSDGPFMVEKLGDMTDWIGGLNVAQDRIGHWCARCMRTTETVAILYVSAGTSVLGLETCADCHSELSAGYGPLVWVTRDRTNQAM